MFSQVHHHQHGLNNTLLSWGWVPGAGSSSGKANGMPLPGQGKGWGASGGPGPALMSTGGHTLSMTSSKNQICAHLNSPQPWGFTLAHILHTAIFHSWWYPLLLDSLKCSVCSIYLSTFKILFVLTDYLHWMFHIYLALCICYLT